MNPTSGPTMATGSQRASGKVGLPSSMISKRKWLHLGILAFLMLGHTLVHYAIIIPGVGERFEHLPFFNLHVLHEAEYLVVIAYASLVFRLWGGLAALLATAAASIPFLFAFRFNIEYVEYGFAGPKNSTIELIVLLAIGAFIVFINEMWGRERDKRIVAYEEVALASRRIEQTNVQLDVTNRRLDGTNQQLDATNRQLTALNAAIQRQLNDVYGTLGDLIRQEANNLPELPPGTATERFAMFLRKISGITGHT